MSCPERTTGWTDAEAEGHKSFTQYLQLSSNNPSTASSTFALVAYSFHVVLMSCSVKYDRWIITNGHPRACCLVVRVVSDLKYIYFINEGRSSVHSFTGRVEVRAKKARWFSSRVSVREKRSLLHDSSKEALEAPGRWWSCNPKGAWSVKESTELLPNRPALPLQHTWIKDQFDRQAWYCTVETLCETSTDYFQWVWLARKRKTTART